MLSLIDAINGCYWWMQLIDAINAVISAVINAVINGPH